MKIYTRRGDEGETGLFGGPRVPKTDPRVRAYGAVDEANAALGLALALDAEGALDPERVAAVQEDLFAVGARLAAADPERARRKGAIPELRAERIAALEAWIDELEETLPPLDAFVLPGGGRSGAQLHVARTVCRRAERAIVALLPEQPDLAEVLLPYMNRLSDLLFVLARAANARAGAPERPWRPRARGGQGAGREGGEGGDGEGGAQGGGGEERDDG